MCGRFSFSVHERFIEETFDVVVSSIVPRYNCAPGQNQIVFVLEENQIVLKNYMWGLIPFWSKEKAKGFINSKSETIHIKPAFKHSFFKRRCVVPADSFYEWKNSEEKIPYRIFLKERSVFAMAGIWDCWKNESGDNLFSFSIITTSSNTFMEPIHSRMPVILDDKNKIFGWLTGDFNFSDCPYFTPIDSTLMEAYSISKKINSPFNNTALLHEKYNYNLKENNLFL